ncbi:hypothetical protein ACHAQA_008028 [Verticillium albo-atrum]
MAQNILITGAAGFIGGSVLADFTSRTSGPISSSNITAVVRSEDQIPALAKLGVNVIQLDLKDEDAVTQAVLENNVDVVIHTAGAIDPRFASHFIKALGKRRQDTGHDTHYFHASVAAMFTEEAGWYAGQVNDTDPLYELEKELEKPNPVRQTSILVTERGKAEGVKTYVLATSIERKRVYRVEENGTPPAVHISDLVALYGIMATKVLQGESIPNGEQGYYLVTAHNISWWEVLDLIAKNLSARGLVDDADVHTWPSWEAAAKGLSLPLPFVKTITASS